MEINKYSADKKYFVYTGYNTFGHNTLNIDPIYNVECVNINKYKIIDGAGNILFIGTKDECEQLINKKS